MSILTLYAVAAMFALCAVTGIKMWNPLRLSPFWRSRRERLLWRKGYVPIDRIPGLGATMEQIPTHPQGHSLVTVLSVDTVSVRYRIADGTCFTRSKRGFIKNYTLPTMRRSMIHPVSSAAFTLPISDHAIPREGNCPTSLEATSGARRITASEMGEVVFWDEEDNIFKETADV